MKPMSNVRVVAIVLVGVLVVLMLLYANGSTGRLLCRHFSGGWLENHGFMTCHSSMH
ncbi:hypothetical protein [Dyella sp. C11]|uniref:hypothetical protein n=1 Tax=Dyella sp. C11 TaxID=2126991 RepID=UPI0013001D99|nr:hypothetical protein [Dyella sp. C11]